MMAGWFSIVSWATRDGPSSFKTGIMVFAEDINGPPSDVVACFGIFRAGVADGEDDPRVGEVFER